MNEWWQSLSSASQVFWGIAIAASIFQVLMFIGSLFTSHELDHSADTEMNTADSGEALKLLSLRGIVAFLVGFGWTGGLFIAKGLSLLLVLLISIGAGIVFMGVILLIMKLLMSLKADGTLNYENAIGQTGHAYIAVPARRAGLGQVEIMVQGRLITAQAVTDHHHAITPQTEVIVTGVESDTLLIVSPTY
jgi:hypothetical protein